MEFANGVHREWKRRVSRIPRAGKLAKYQVSELYVSTEPLALMLLSTVSCEEKDVNFHTYRLTAMLAALQTSGYNLQWYDTVAIGITRLYLAFV